MDVVLLTKSDDWSSRAYEIARAALGSRLKSWNMVGSQEKFQPFQYETLKTYHYIADTLISFLYPFVIPDYVLAAHKLAINFHPAPVEYPGTGCYNFAIYNRATEYGATCHHMAPKVDSGPVIMERRFELLPTDNVAALKERTMAVMLGMFAQVVSDIAAEKQLPTSNKKWTREAYRRKDLDELAVLRPDMSPDEIDLRTRATTFGKFTPKITICGREFHPD